MDQLKSIYGTWVALPQPKKIKIVTCIAFCCYTMFLLLLVIYGFGSTSKKTSTIPNTVVFMESMPASLQSLRYLAKRRDVHISMVVLTVNSWVTNLDAAYENLAAFLQLLKLEGYSNTLPIYYGNSVATVNLNFFSEVNFSQVPMNTTACTYNRVISDSLRIKSERIFNAAGQLDGISITNAASCPAFFAPVLDTFLAKNSANFLVLGPSTDPALFIENYPSRRSAIKTIYMAGGSFSGTGDVKYFFRQNQVAEANFFFDPAAADYILQGTHGRPVVLLPLDVTVEWPSETYDALVTAESGAREPVTSGGVVADALKGYYDEFGAEKKMISVAVAAAAYMSDTYLQSGAGVTNIDVAVTNGVTMSTDGQSYRPASSSYRSANVVLQVNSENFWSHLINVDKLHF